MKSLTLLISLFIFTIGKASGQTEDIPKGYAIVVGAYSLNNLPLAIKFSSHVKELGYPARFGLNESRTLILVYIDHTQSFKEAIAKMKEIRLKENLEDTWVHVKTSEARLELTAEQKAKAEKTAKVMKKEVVNSLGDIYADRFKNVKKDNDIAEKPEQEIDVLEHVSTSVEIKKEERIIKKENAPVVKDNRLEMMFALKNSTNGELINGELQIIDTERSRLFNLVKAGEYVKIDDPKNNTGQVTVIADVFGFRKQQLEFNYYDPYHGATNAKIDSATNGPILNMDLVRYRKGDIITMYNVFYFKDAAVMQPESKYEISGLLSMMKENEKLKIKIHGHVNGKHSGPIIGVEGNNFFALSDNNPKGFGTAKELSKQRAEVIRDYLIQEGIAPERMQIKAWGGKRMLHDKHSNKAKENVRVEIEILAE